MKHYVCKGECDGESESPTRCDAKECSLYEKDLKECDCTDGKHYDNDK